VSSVVAAMSLVLLMVAYIGEAIREAFDPKQFTFYE
jgi:microcin C transport system permease protein